jgi:hypothetical protein
MRLVLAPNPTEGTHEKLLKSRDQKSGQKISKITKMKNIAAQDKRCFNPNAQLY